MTVASSHEKTKIIIFIGLILVISFIAFLPALKNGFIYSDDYNYVIKNDLIRDLSWRGIKNIFTSIHLGLYKPLTILSFAVEYHFFKLNPHVYHLTNVILHLINCLLVFWLILLISRKLWVAFIVALFFGVHPMHVESVAWISERKDVLYSLFFLSGIITYIYSAEKKNNIYHWLTFMLFILSFMVKPMALTFPFILLLCDYLLGVKIDADNLKRKAIFFVTSALLLVFTLIFAGGYSSQNPSFNFFDNILIASYALLFYLTKIILPAGLSPLYPSPDKQGNFLPFIFLISPIIVLALAGVITLLRRYSRKIVFGSLFFLICLFPVLQLMPTGNAIVADRYSYLSSIGIFFIIAEFMVWFYEKKLKFMPVLNRLALPVLVVMIAMLSFMARERTKVWKDSDTWFNDILKLRPPQLKEKIEFYKKEIALNPKSAQAYNDLAVIYGNLGSNEAAAYLCQKALEVDPNYTQTYSNLSAVFGFAGNFDKSIEFAEKGIASNPNDGSAYNNLAVAYYYRRQYQLAIQSIDKAIALGFKPAPEFLKTIEKYRHKDISK